MGRDGEVEREGAFWDMVVVKREHVGGNGRP